MIRLHDVILLYARGSCAAACDSIKHSLNGTFQKGLLWGVLTRQQVRLLAHPTVTHPVPHCLPLLLSRARHKPQMHTSLCGVTGAQEEFLFVGRLDNLCSSYCSLAALLDAYPSETALKDEPAVKAVALFDHEEVGSSSAQGGCNPCFHAHMRLGKGSLRMSVFCALVRFVVTSTRRPQDDVLMSGGGVQSQDDARDS